MKYILTIDAGTTSIRALLFDVKKNIIAKVEKQHFKQYFPKPAWVEHDAEEIWNKIVECVKKVCKGIPASEIYGIGITNQRETVVCWDKLSGQTLSHAIVWQCRRTAKECEKLKKSPMANVIKEKTGLLPDAYFSATKIKWLMENVPEVGRACREHRLCVGTIESYLVFKLTGGKSFVSDVTNACRTMLFNIHTMDWDDELVEFFGVPREVLPKVVANDKIVGKTTLFGGEIPVAGLIGDQQGSLFGQGCFEKGMVKNTFGTGCFMLFNTGKEILESKTGLLSTVGYKIKGKVCYALEGSVFNSGSTVDWAIDNLGVAKNPTELTTLATSIEDNEGVYLVPAFTGLGTPYWDMEARATISGITRGTDKRHIARSVLESMAYSCYDVLNSMEQETGIKIKELHVDGGGSVNDFLMQFVCDLVQTRLVTSNMESTCMGAMFMTGLATGAYETLGEIKSLLSSQKTFTPQKTFDEMKPLLDEWHRAVKMTINRE